MTEEADSFCMFDHLPDEILFNIISFIQPQIRNPISLVNWRFYSTVCSLERNIFPLSLNYKMVS